MTGDRQYNKTIRETKLYTKLNVNKFIKCCEDINMLEELRTKKPASIA